MALLSTTRAPIALDLALDWRVLGFTVATTAMTALLFGVAPAFRATRVAPIEALNAQGRTAAGDAPSSLSNSLIVAQVVLSLVLLVVAGLFLQTFERLSRVPLGFDRDHVVVVSVNAPTVSGDRAQPIVWSARSGRGERPRGDRGGRFNESTDCRAASRGLRGECAGHASSPRCRAHSRR